MFYNDIYFQKKYGKLYEKIDEGKLEIFEFKSEDGIIQNMYIRREIPAILDEKKYYDIITPYGYGGPVILSCHDQSKKAKLVKGYYQKFAEYCLENNIVSEFIRFHPINNNGEDFTEVYEVAFLRKTVGTNLKAYEDPVASEFRPDCIRKIRKAIKLGVRNEIIKSPGNLDVFKDLYYQTMDRNHAVEYYYFDNEYFDHLILNLKDELILSNVYFEDSIIASAIFFASVGLIHFHLAGSLYEYPYLSPGLVLQYGMVNWGKENGFDYIHYGGGRTNDENDMLLRFKKNFGKNTRFNFCVGKKIWLDEVYSKLCEINRVSPDIEFFPAYRNKKLMK